jgi:hypothetical protein
VWAESIALVARLRGASDHFRNQIGLPDDVNDVKDPLLDLIPFNQPLAHGRTLDVESFYRPIMRE